MAEAEQARLEERQTVTAEIRLGMTEAETVISGPRRGRLTDTAM